MLAAVGLAVAGFVGASAQPAPVRQVAGDELPWDVSAILGAVLLAMRSTGEVDAAPVAFARGALASVREPGFDYAGFRLDRVVITAYGPAPGGGGLALAAALSLSDAGGRRTAVSLTASYHAQDRRLLITAADVLPLVPAQLAVRQFILPGPLAAQMPQGEALTYVALLDYVSRNALSDRAPPPAPREAQDYRIFAFFLDRLPPAAETQLVVAEQEDGVSGDPGQPVVIDDQGWRVVVQRISFALNAGRPLYFKALYRPAGDAAAPDGVRIVARMSSHLGPPAPAGEAAPAAPGVRLGAPNLLDRN